MIKKNSETRNAEATRRSILLAAENIFAEKGFSGTTIRDISKASGASGPLILFHFQDKRGLYEAVKAAIVESYMDKDTLQTPPGENSYRCIEHYIKSMFRFYRENPTMVKLANWGRLEGDTNLWPGEDEWHRVYLDHIKAAQARGEIREDISPVHICIMLSGAIHIWWEYHDHFLKQLGMEERSAEADRQYNEQWLAVIMQGLCSEPRSTSSMGDTGAETEKPH